MEEEEAIPEDVLTSVLDVQGDVQMPLYSDDLIDALIARVGETRTKYSNIVFSHDQAAIAVGARPFQLLTSWCWYPRVGEVYDETRVCPSVVLYGIEKAGAEAGLKLIEIFN